MTNVLSAFLIKTHLSFTNKKACSKIRCMKIYKKIFVNKGVHYTMNFFYMRKEQTAMYNNLPY